MKKVSVLTVTYGKRGNFLEQVVESVIHDKHLDKMVVVDNASRDQEILKKLEDQYTEKLVVLHEEKNTGSAGGFASGLEYVRGLESDYVLLLDDDNVPEADAISTFLHSMEKFEGKRVVLVGNRVDIGDVSVFTSRPHNNHALEKTFFNVFSPEKFPRYLSRIFGWAPRTQKVAFQEFVPSRGFVYGGAFLPIDAVRRAPLPDGELVLYGDDVEYSWGVYDAGYESYLCSRPIIRDVDMTFEEGDHILGLFRPTTHPFKVYYRIRNMIRISRRHTKQSGLTLFLSVFVWIGGLLVLGLFKYGPTRSYFSRVYLIMRAVYAGYRIKAAVPKVAHLP